MPSTGSVWSKTPNLKFIWKILFSDSPLNKDIRMANSANENLRLGPIPVYWEGGSAFKFYQIGRILNLKVPQKFQRVFKPFGKMKKDSAFLTFRYYRQGYT